MKLSGDFQFKLIVTAVAIGAAAYVIYRGANAAGDLAQKGLDLVNPVNPDNLVNQGANAVYRAATGNEYGTIGTGIYDATHDGTFNPTSTNNILYPHNDHWSLGGWIYDVTH